jgi:hypothetical protein
MIADTPITPMAEMRVSPLFRRLAVMAFAGAMICLACPWPLYEYGLLGKEILRPLPLFIIAISAGLVCGPWVLRQRLRVDNKGIWRRRFVRWDLWPWDAFSSGRIREGSGKDCFFFPEKSRYWRSLALEFLADSDRALVRMKIDELWKRPPPPELPTKFEIQGGGLGMRGIRFSEAGVSIARWFGRFGPVASWADLPYVELERSDHSSKRFQEARIAIPGRKRPIRLIVHGGRCNWRGADAEMIAAFLEMHVPQSNFWIDAQNGPPKDLAEHARRLATIDKRLRKNKGLIWLGFVELFFVLLFVGFCLPRKFSMDPRGWDTASSVSVIMTISLLALCPLAFWVAFLEGRKVLSQRRAELEAWREQNPPRT